MRRRLLAIVVGVATLVTGFGVSSAASAPEVTSRAPAVIDAVLVKAIAKSGSATAIVSTWDRKGLDAVSELGITGRRMRVLPMLTTKLTGSQLSALRASSAVRSVFAPREIRLLLEDTTWITGARDVWDGSEGAPGVTGAGVHVAVIDSGIDGRHLDAGNLVEYCEASHTSDQPEAVLCSPNEINAGPAGPTGDPRQDAGDDVGALGHGSHVSGIVAGTGAATGGKDAPHSNAGVAPDAKLHVYSWTNGIAGTNLATLSAYDDLIDKKLNHDSPVVAVNNSWGSVLDPLDPQTPDFQAAEPVQIAIKAAHDAGILNVFAAGNNGPLHNTLSAMCLNPWAVCVAATSRGDGLASFSSRGRQSEPADTNLDGVVGDPADRKIGNHDRSIARRFNVGLYRPSLAAPGANVLSIAYPASATGDSQGLCHEGNPTPAAGCYVRQSGTSMAAPHVTGAAAVITQAFRQAHNRDPEPDELMDILERSANKAKLPSFEAEEIGAGRLDVRSAVKLARTYAAGSGAPIFGHASPPYDKHPGQLALLNERGCAPTGGLAIRNQAETGVAQIDDATGLGASYGQHFVDVPPDVDRLRVMWDFLLPPDAFHTGAASFNTEIFPPGVDPDDAALPAGPDRIFPAGEGAQGADIASPEPGRWTVRVFVDAAVPPTHCDPASAESPKRTHGFNYQLTASATKVSQRPQAAIDRIAKSDGDWTVEGTASYPSRWDGVTNWEVAGTLAPGAVTERVHLVFDGNEEDGCTGVGPADIDACDGPFLREQPSDATAPAAKWPVPAPNIFGSEDELVGVDFVADPTAVEERTPTIPNWIWQLDEPAAFGGDMTVNWWASCNVCNVIGLWDIELWADGTKVFEKEGLATVNDLPGVPDELSTTVTVPGFEASDHVVLRIEPKSQDAQSGTVIFYDGNEPCLAAVGEACTSSVDIPLASDVQSGPEAPKNIRVTDIHDGLRVAWDGSAGATSYEIHRSLEPRFAVTAASLLATVAGASCMSPNVPSWPTASRSGTCYTDSTAVPGETYYYRAVAVDNEGNGGAPSLLSYGTPTTYDRVVRVQADRPYARGAWEFATVDNADATDWTHLWNRDEISLGGQTVGARSYTQGVGSDIVTRPDNLAPNAVNDNADAHTSKVTIDVLANDSDPDGDELEVTDVPATSQHGGSLVLNDDGSVDYRPAAGFFGTDRFTYEITDGYAGTDSAVVTINVSNTAPVATDDNAITDEDRAVTIDVLRNDSDADGDALMMSVGTTTAHGTLAKNGDGTITYAPANNFHGVDGFDYTISDGSGATDTAHVTVSVLSVNDAPVAVDDAASTKKNQFVTINVLGNDTDPEGQTLSLHAVDARSFRKGTLTKNPNGTVKYTPPKNFRGTDRFSYTASDGHGGTDSATVTVTVR